MNMFQAPDQFRDADDERTLARPAEPTAPTQAMIERLLALVRSTFYSIYPPARWFHDHKHLLMVITWPATWLNQRGITLPLGKYEAILQEIINEIRAHGDTAKIKHFPTYLEHAVKQWFIHRGEALYEQQKSLRNAMDLRFLKGLNPTPSRQPDPIEAMAAANRVLASGRRKNKGPETDESQGSLF